MGRQHLECSLALVNSPMTKLEGVETSLWRAECIDLMTPPRMCRKGLYYISLTWHHFGRAFFGLVCGTGQGGA